MNLAGLASPRFGQAIKLAGGGLAGRTPIMNMMTAQPQQSPSIAAGLVQSLVPGRTDQLPLDVDDGSYVLPADVVSGLGQGNTMAGASLLEKLFSDGHARSGLAAGGSASSGKKVPVMVAGGEVLVSPDQVYRLGVRETGGKGSQESIMAAGHKALDRMVIRIREQSVKHTKKLPGPKK